MKDSGVGFFRCFFFFFGGFFDANPGFVFTTISCNFVNE